MAEVDLQHKIDAFLEAAYKKFMVRDYDSAIRELKAAEVLDRSNPEILYNLGINYCRLGLFKTSLEYFTRILNSELTFIDSLDVKKLLAYACIRVSDYAKSEQFADQILELVPSDIVALNLKGYCQEMRGDHSEAIQTYKTVIAEDTNNYNAYNSIAYIMAKSGGDLNQSLKFARIAYESNPENPSYQDTLGYVYMKLGRLDTAENYLNSAFNKNPLSLEINEHLREFRKLLNP
jgi:tetratricopeptide (TPR) repeat protein